jgi:hypothetical protein
MSKLVAGVLHGNSIVEAASRDLVGSPGHSFQRVQHLADEAMSGKSRGKERERKDEEQNAKRHLDLPDERACAVGEPNQERASLNSMGVADEINIGSIAEANSSAVKAGLTFTPEWRASEDSSMELVTRERHGSVRFPDFKEPIDQEAGLRAIEVFLVEAELARWAKIEQTFHGHHILNFSAIELAGQLPILQQGCTTYIGKEHNSKSEDMPES